MADPTQTDIEERLKRAIAEIEGALEGTPHLRWHIVRGLVHQAVHLAAEKSARVEFCQLATYLAEMINHAHAIQHGNDPAAHRDVVH